MSIAAATDPRLEHRGARLDEVIAALEERVRAHRSAGEAVPRPLREALAGFAAERDEVRRALERP